MLELEVFPGRLDRERGAVGDPVGAGLRPGLPAGGKPLVQKHVAHVLEGQRGLALDLVRNGIAERGARSVERSSVASQEDVQRLKSLVLENDRLKRLLAEQMLENAALRDLKR